jgi:hypothetical protein
MRDDIQAASAVIRSAIERMEGPLPPAFLVEFLLRHWRVYLARVHAQQGAGAAIWTEAVAVTERLLWSVSPKAAPADRTALASAIKPLLDGIRRGAKVAAMTEQAQRSFLDELSRWHLWLINPAANPAPVDTKADEKDMDLSATLRLDAMDPRYRKIMDLLESDNVEEISF